MNYRMLSIDDVELDIENPRIKQYLEFYPDGNIPAEAVHLALSGGGDSTESYRALKQSIKTNGGIISPVLVNRRTNGTMVVIEGNTRLQIYKEFAEKDAKWSTIPAIVFDDLEQSRIDAIRLQSHLVGPRDWDPFSKAKYLYQLVELDHMPIDTVVEFCGGKKNEVLLLIAAYKDVLNYYNPAAAAEGADVDTRDFSKFVELQKGSVYQSIVLQGKNKNDFAEWVVKGKIDTAQNVRTLPEVLKNPAARECFYKTNLRDALKILARGQTSGGLSDATFSELVSEINSRIPMLTLTEYKSIVEDMEETRKLETMMESIKDIFFQE